jgi:hypothetical protein
MVEHWRRVLLGPQSGYGMEAQLGAIEQKFGYKAFF